jgi:hypothetical protein
VDSSMCGSGRVDLSPIHIRRSFTDATSHSSSSELQLLSHEVELHFLIN